MKRKHIPGRLYLLREEIAALCVVKCRMSHERIIGAREVMLPASCSPTESKFKRVGLCKTEVRANRLGCSHTSARIRLKDAIDELNQRDEEGADLLRNELNWLDNQIHLLDHRKGEAEKTLARLRENISATGGSGDSARNLLEAENEISALELVHDEYVERIGRLRDRIIIQIDKLL